MRTDAVVQLDQQVSKYLLDPIGSGNAFYEGYSAVNHAARAQRSRVYRERYLRFEEGLTALMEGRDHPQVWLYKMRESMGIGDFPLLMGDSLERTLLAGYAEAPYSWSMIAKRGTLRDFRDAKRFDISGGDGTFGDAISAGEPYPEEELSESRYLIRLGKYGKRMPLFWELLINDDLGAFSDIVQRFGKAARRSEEKKVTSLYCVNDTMFSNGNGNIVNTTNGAASNNPVLSVAGLQDAFNVFSRQLDQASEPILIEGVVLVVPPALEVTALNILNALTVEAVEAGGTSNQKIIIQNWLRSRIRLAVAPYLPIIDTTANKHKTWFLFADPGSGRPAIEFDFLRGREQPEVFLKAPNAIRVGAGSADPLDGDFDHDQIDYKVRHVYGGAVIDPKMAVRSNGSAS